MSKVISNVFSLALFFTVASNQKLSGMTDHTQVKRQITYQNRRDNKQSIADAIKKHGKMHRDEALGKRRDIQKYHNK